MGETIGTTTCATGVDGPSDAAGLGRWLHGLGQMSAAESESEAIDRITALEELKSACAAAPARETAALEKMRRAAEGERGITKSRQCRGLASEVGLARKVSPQKGGRYLGFSRALHEEMPHTMAALQSGVLTEDRATILVKETAYLTRATREEIDRRVCADPEALVGTGDRELEAEVKRHAYELDPKLVVARHAKASKDRRVSVRPAPDVMSQVSALLPVAQGVSVYAALKKHADSVVGADDRTHAQIMADTLVERVTGAASATTTPVAVNVIISDRALLGLSEDAAEVAGYGPIPAAVARALVADSVDPQGATASTLRRLYAKPSDGALVTMESRARAFPSALAHYVRMRDRRCRVAYCDGVIAEIDHAVPHHAGGATAADNADGSCRAHNLAKESGGWTYVAVDTTGGSTFEIYTPTGGRHLSLAPPVVGHHPPDESGIETRTHALVNAS